MTRLAAILLLLLSVAASSAADSVSGKVDFNRDIRPILSNTCAKCHGPDPKERKGGTDGLRLDVRADAIADLGGYAAIVPGQPAKSALVQRITSSDDDEHMPPKSSGKKLTPREIELLTRWIEQGAEYAQHWSYVKPVRPPLPKVEGTLRAPLSADNGARSVPSTLGSGGRTGLTYDQCWAYSAPCSIQRVSSSISRGVSFFPLDLGGMCSSSSLEVIRCTSALLAGWPGTIAA